VKPQSERYTFTIEAKEQDAIPAVESVRRWLKEGRRQLRLIFIYWRRVEADEHSTRFAHRRSLRQRIPYVVAFSPLPQLLRPRREKVTCTVTQSPDEDLSKSAKTVVRCRLPALDADGQSEQDVSVKAPVRAKAKSDVSTSRKKQSASVV
jgi:hypothetical protein